MTLSKLQYEKRRRDGSSRERDILDYFRRNPKSTPDGSFVMNMYLLGFREGRADLRKELKNKAKGTR